VSDRMQAHERRPLTVVVVREAYAVHHDLGARHGGTDRASAR
jgi:hypothetical protein